VRLRYASDIAVRAGSACSVFPSVVAHSQTNQPDLLTV